MIKTAPSILSSDFSRFGEEIARLDRSSCDYIHVDVMDGHFVPNLTFGAPVVKAMRPFAKKVFDVHLMMDQPEKYLADFREAGADIIGIHREIRADLKDVLARIRALGARASLTFNPDTPVDGIEEFLPLVDQVLLMSVHPGFGGQSFIPAALDKGYRVRQAIRKGGHPVDLEIDGGINAETARLAREAGFNVLVAGSWLYKHPDFEAGLASLRG
ncbi:MAG: ribulose-phosphate 3-epimerase [Spirochaetes bacterium]|nr:ribulose-phosphate 3-epimerase [Spirochaetota bacterium]